MATYTNQRIVEKLNNRILDITFSYDLYGMTWQQARIEIEQIRVLRNYIIDTTVAEAIREWHRRDDLNSQPSNEDTVLDHLSRMLTRIGASAVLILAATLSAHAQATPAKPPTFFTKTNVALFSTDFLARTLDAESTRRFMTAPCHCYYEKNIPSIAAHSSTMYAYSIGVAALNTLGAYELTKHHHPRLAKALLATDIAYESHYVVENYRLVTR